MASGARVPNFEEKTRPQVVKSCHLRPEQGRRQNDTPGPWADQDLLFLPTLQTILRRIILCNFDATAALQGR